MSSSTKPTTGIEDLPSEMISELFNYLPPKNLVASSMVNKRWNSIYAAFKVHKLFVDEDLKIKKWYDTNQTVEEKCFCRPAMFRLLVEKPLLSNLKRLAIYKYNFEFDFDELNRFSQLVHLEIDIHTPYSQKKLHLNLPKLKVLVFIGWNEDYSISIDCPQLSTLVYQGEKKDANWLDLKHPETIRKLETCMTGPKLVPFKNVECMVTRGLRVISKTILQSLPALKELCYNQDISGMFEIESYHGAGTVHRVKRTLSEFLDEAKKLKGSDFRFTFAGLQLTNVNVNQIDFGVQYDETNGEEYVHTEYVYMKYYHLIEPGTLHFVNWINYTSLLRYVTGEFPRCFSQKFTDVHSVHAGQVQDVDHFLWFLKSLKSLRRLFLLKTGLGQEFYDQLPVSAHSLTKLELRDEHCENFDFVDQLSRLSDLIIEPTFSLESLPLLIKWLGRFEKGSFNVRLINKCVFNIRKCNFPEWTVSFEYRHVLLKSENPDEIANLFKALQEKQERKMKKKKKKF